MKAHVNIESNPRRLVSIVLHKEENATLVIAKQKSVLFPDGCVKWAIK